MAWTQNFCVSSAAFVSSTRPWAGRERTFCFFKFLMENISLASSQVGGRERNRCKPSLPPLKSHSCAKQRSLVQKLKSSYIRRMALHLRQYIAIYLAEPITGLLQKVLTHPAVEYKCSTTHTEVLGASHFALSCCCASSGLVKIVCLPFDGAAEQKHGRKKVTDTRFETMIGPISWVDSLFIWFPASRCSQREKLHAQ